jgi:hypothetical protein
VLRLKERGWREVIVHKEAPAERMPFDHGRFEIMVEDEEGRQYGQEVFAQDDFHDVAPGDGAAIDTLVLCEDCDRFFYEGEAECPHCRADGPGPTTEDAVASVRTAQRVMQHVSEIERILRHSRESAGYEGMPRT